MSNFKYSSLSRWNLFSWAILFLIVFFGVLRWPLGPYFIDIYYHLLVMQRFSEAGGYVTEDFWEFAPVGRPHLYPPLFHILLLLFYRLGFSEVFIARIFEFLMVSLFFFFIWYLIKDLFSDRTAFFCLLTSFSLYGLYLSSVNNMPATLSLIFCLVTFWCIEKRKSTAALILMTLNFYTHSLFSWISFFSLLIYCFISKKNSKKIEWIFWGSFIFSLPLFLHQFLNLSYVRFQRHLEDYLLELNLAVIIFSILGGWACLRYKERSLFFIGLLLGMLPLSIIYKYRFFSAQGSLSLALLAGIALDYLYLRFSKRKEIILSLAVIIFFVFSPSIIFSPEINFKLCNSTVKNLLLNLKDKRLGHELSIYYPKYYNEIINIIKKYTQKDEIIYANLNYFSGILALFSKRAISSGMLTEIRPRKIFDPLKVSRLIIWIKRVDNRGVSPLFSYLIEKYKLKRLTETEIAYIYINPSASAKYSVPSALLPIKVLFIILAICIVLILKDLLKKVDIKENLC